VTGEADFPETLSSEVHGSRLDCYCNTRVSYQVRGVHVTLNVLWDFEAAPGAGDMHLAVVRGSRARVEVRQGKEQNYRPELYVVPESGAESAVRAGLERKVAGLQQDFPGVGLETQPGQFRVTIPEAFRVGHEAHFSQVTRQFLRYLQEPASLPTWEKPNLLAKYRVTTEGVQLARRVGSG
jgi:hypothetical protein